MTDLAVSTQVDLSPRTLDEALRFADILSKSTIVPKDFVNNPGNIFVAIQWGSELGLKPMQAMQNIAVINGRPSLWGDACLALVRNSPLCEYVIETDDGHAATCRAKRKGQDEHVSIFSIDDAKTAGLSGKAGPWVQYPKRMRQMRARAFALRDVFTDVLKGMPIAEEVQDYDERVINPETDKREKQPAEQKALPLMDEEKFKLNFVTYEKGIKSGRKTSDDVIKALVTKYTLSDDQINAIKSIPAPIEGELAE